MILNVSESTANAMLEAVSVAMDGASLELLTAGGELLVELGLFDPGAAIDGELVFKVADGVAVQSGTAKWARAVAAGGSEIFSCDVGTEDSDCVIKLNTTKIERDTGVKLKQFRLIMP